MKKLLVVLMTVALVLTASAMMVSAVEPSAEGALIADVAIGIDKTNTKVSIRVVNSKNSVAPFTVEFNKLKEQDNTLNIIANKELTLEGTGNPTFPVTITFKVTGATASSKGYFLLKKADGSIVTIQAIMGDGEATAEFPEIGEVVFVSNINATAIEIPSTPTDGKKHTSEPTADGMAPVAAILCLGAFAVGVSAKKLFA